MTAIGRQGVGMPSERRAGILLHPTSLPGPYGIGDIGPSARSWLGWLEAAGQRIWQMLPIHPTDRHGSPYASPSAFAGASLLLSIDDLIADGWLRHGEKPWGTGAPDRVRWADVWRRKGAAVALAADRVVAAGAVPERFVAERPWLQDWARYDAAAALHGPHWTSWPEALRDREALALTALDDRTEAAQARAVALEWLFEQQWTALRAEAARRGVSLLGDVPIFVGGHAADVWAHRALFRLDAQGHPTVETGVPPDAFSVHGQRWGTPHYDVAAHAATGYAWWVDRLAAELGRFDEVRIDHFRGLAAAWEVPVDGAPVDGRWAPGLGAGMLAAAKDRLGSLPFLAEDLGVITPDVEALRDDFGLRGMAILQFGFSDARRAPDHAYLPHRHRPHLVVYPGTHDNAPVAAWYADSDEPTRDHFRRYTRTDGKHPASTMLRLAWRSVADTVICAWQDVLGLGAEARMNTPGVAEGNWAWRTTADTFSLSLAELLAEEARLSGR